MGYSDVSVYGDLNGISSTASTPNMDALADEGMLFTNAHSASAVCTPSRYALLTGNYNWRTLNDGVSGSYGAPEIPSSDVTIAEYLKTQGYETAAFGKWHLGGTFYNRQGQAFSGRNTTVTDPVNVDWERPLEGHALDNGFDVFKGLPCAIGRPPYVYLDGDRLQYFDTSTNQYRDALNTDAYHLFNADELDDGLTEGTSHREGLGDPSYVQREAGPKMIAEAEQYIADRVGDTDPFFMYVALYSPHTPWQVTAPFAGSEGFQYGDFMREVDDRMGRIINAIDNHGFKDNTIVIISSDNGPEKAAFISTVANGRDGNGPFKGIKRDSWEGGTRIPFIVRWPGLVSAGTTSDALTWQGDIFRTLADFYGDCLPQDVAPDAVSILSILNGNATSVPRNAVVSASNNNQLSIKTNDGWKLIDGTGGGGKDTSFDGDNNELSNAKGTIGGSPKQLYYLPNDIAETNNLEASNAIKATEMLDLLNDIRQGLPENSGGGDETLNLIPTETLTVAAATPADDGGLSGNFVLRERTVADNNPNKHISGFIKFDVSSIGTFNAANGDLAFIEVKITDRLNTNNAAELKVARITGGAWDVTNPPLYTWATASLAPIGPGSQADELILVNNVATAALNSTHSINVTSIVENWSNGNIPDYGFGLYLTEAYQGVSLQDIALNIQTSCNSITCNVGAACDDSDDCTINDVYDNSCNCRGTLIDQNNDNICDLNCIDIQLSAWLEGTYDPTLGEMTNTLSSVRKLLPGQTPNSQLATPTPAGQPYHITPWNYVGTEGAGWTDADYTGDETDWVLVSFRTGMAKNTEVGMTAALLMKDGSITFPDRCALTSTVASPLYIVVEHRNHIGIMTPQPVNIINSALTYDFRSSDSFRDPTSFGQKQLPNGEWAMFAGDANQMDFPSFDVNGTDKTEWFKNGINFGKC